MDPDGLCSSNIAPWIIADIDGFSGSNTSPLQRTFEELRRWLRKADFFRDQDKWKAIS
jgi:hypothetical protein